jgi:hypothetical protein
LSPRLDLVSKLVVVSSLYDSNIRRIKYGMVEYSTQISDYIPCQSSRILHSGLVECANILLILVNASTICSYCAVIPISQTTRRALRGLKRPFLYTFTPRIDSNNLTSTCRRLARAGSYSIRARPNCPGVRGRSYAREHRRSVPSRSLHHLPCNARRLNTQSRH